MRTSNQVATLEIAKAEFEASWKQWKAWAGIGRGGVNSLQEHPAPEPPLRAKGPAANAQRGPVR